jgi:endonuclease YncB( thermonuclease family)
VRLFVIDAPEKGQSCDDGQWHPGPLAKKALEDFIAGRPVTCKQVDYDARNNRPVAQCFAGDDDLQAMMVSAGWAWSFGRYSERYVPEEKEAANAKAGVHHSALGVAGAAALEVGSDCPSGGWPVAGDHPD